MAEAGLFKVISDYAKEYFYGFDKNQLEINLLSGRIVMKSVMIRPDKIQDVMDDLEVPVSVKSVLLRNVHI